MFCKKNLLTAIIFLGFEGLVAMDSHQTACQPNTQINWNLRFDQLNTQLGGALESTAAKFEINYLGEHLYEKLQLLTSELGNDASLLACAIHVGKPLDLPTGFLFIKMVDNPEELFKVICNTNVISALRIALRVYVCYCVERLILDGADSSIKVFLNKFDGGFYLNARSNVADAEKLEEIRTDDIVNFVTIMWNLFDMKLVRDVIIQEVPNFDAIFASKKYAVKTEHKSDHLGECCLQ